MADKRVGKRVDKRVRINKELLRASRKLVIRNRRLSEFINLVGEDSMVTQNEARLVALAIEEMDEILTGLQVIKPRDVEWHPSNQLIQ